MAITHYQDTVWTCFPGTGLSCKNITCVLRVLGQQWWPLHTHVCVSISQGSVSEGSTESVCTKATDTCFTLHSSGEQFWRTFHTSPQEVPAGLSHIFPHRSTKTMPFLSSISPFLSVYHLQFLIVVYWAQIPK